MLFKKRRFKKLILTILGAVFVILGLVLFIFGTWAVIGFITILIQYFTMTQVINLTTFLFITLLGFSMIWFGLEFIFYNILKTKKLWLHLKSWNRLLIILLLIIFISIFLFKYLETKVNNPIISCQSDNDCTMLDCEGLGPWYCDTSGSPHCSAKHVCSCYFACL
jgi:hypothetical protein